MGGSSVDDDWEFTPSSEEEFSSPAKEKLISASKEVRTVVLVGKTGNGKSATGNSILGRKVFKSRASSSGVTSSCELQKTELNNGMIVNVIDTPGLFDLSAGSEFIGKEIAKCIDLAKDGIHAIVLVLSVRARFTEEEENALRSLQRLFGSKIIDYMIVVFTGGDDLEENEETLNDYLGRDSDCPGSLKEILSLCGNRHVLFDNKTKDEKKRFGQVQQLLELVSLIVSQNGGRPYTDELFTEIKKGAMKLHSQQRKVDSLEGYSERQKEEFRKDMQQAYEEQLKHITEMIESKLKEATTRLEQQLAEEQAARLRAENSAKAAQKKSEEEIKKLRENLEKAQDELRKRGDGGCTIL